MKPKNNEHIYSIYGINNSCELLRLKKDKIKSIFLLNGSKAFKNDYIKKNIISIKEKYVVLEKHEFNKKFPNLRSQGIVINFEFKPNYILPKFSNKNVCLLIGTKAFLVSIFLSANFFTSSSLLIGNFLSM